VLDRALLSVTDGGEPIQHTGSFVYNDISIADSLAYNIVSFGIGIVLNDISVTFSYAL
jgi:hypothetical protein